jgi:hypothetical protein
VLSALANDLLHNTSNTGRRSLSRNAGSTHSLAKVTEKRKKLTMPQLCKLIEEVYSANFTRNTMRLKSRKMCGEYVQGDDKLA